VTVLAGDKRNQEEIDTEEGVARRNQPEWPAERAGRGKAYQPEAEREVEALVMSKMRKRSGVQDALRVGTEGLPRTSRRKAGSA